MNEEQKKQIVRDAAARLRRAAQASEHGWVDLGRLAKAIGLGAAGISPRDARHAANGYPSDRSTLPQISETHMRYLMDCYEAGMESGRREQAQREKNAEAIDDGARNFYGEGETYHSAMAKSCAAVGMTYVRPAVDGGE